MPGYHSDAQRMEARARRRNMTAAQAHLWRHLRAHRLCNLHVRRHAPLGPWIVDFLITRHRLVIEVAEVRLPDRARAEDIAARGYDILRFWDRDILRDVSGILDRLSDEVSLRSAPQGTSQRQFSTTFPD